MQFSESWLRQFVNPDIDTKSLADLMTMAGLEVESFGPKAKHFSGVVVGFIVNVIPHPNADRLRVCEVDIGRDKLSQIVCGAKNVKEGMKVPCALVGALIPGKSDNDELVKIDIGQLRGVASFGMLCSADELKVSGNEDGIMVLPDDAPIGIDFYEYLGFSDPIFNVKLTPNRADCLSVFGIAREISIFTGSSLKNAKPNGQPFFPSGIFHSHKEVVVDKEIKTDVFSNELCGRFSSRIVLGLDAKIPTPDWIVRRLSSAGQRSISILVDLSNYFLLEYGIPSHIYDLDKVEGSLAVRWARPHESLTLLNGNTIQLESDVGVVADERGPLSLAGIMGGLSSSVDHQTKNVLIEVAFWHPDAIRGRSRRYRLSTEAGHRFERGVDAFLMPEFLKYFSEFLVSLCGGRLGSLVDKVQELPSREVIKFQPLEFERQIGVPLSGAECEKMLKRLYFEVSSSNVPMVQQSDSIKDLSCNNNIIAPSYRFDIQGEIDIVGELARLYGFDLIPSRMPQILPRVSRRLSFALDVDFFRNRMAMLGYNETINYSFVDMKDESDLMSNKEPIRLLNPLSNEMAVMRSSLLPGLLKVLEFNLNRDVSRVFVFEIGRVFQKFSNTQKLEQPIMLAGLAYGNIFDDQWCSKARVVDFFDLKGDVESLLEPFYECGQLSFETPKTQGKMPSFLHPGRSALIYINGNIVGSIGELHPGYFDEYDLTKAPIFFELLVEKLPNIKLPKIEAISRFPAVRRDVALVVDKKMTADKVKDVLFLAAKQHVPLVLDLFLFDVFIFDEDLEDINLQGKKSLAFAITIQDTQKTLTDKVIDDIVGTLVQAAKLECNAIFRH